ASRAARARSFGPSAIRSVSSAPRMPAFSLTRPTSLARRTSAVACSGRNAALIALTVFTARSTEPVATASCTLGASTPPPPDARAPGAAGPTPQPRHTRPDRAGIPDQRDTGAHRRRPANRDIGRSRHREPDRGEPKHQPVGLLAHRKMLAFAHNIPDIAEHEE